MANKKRALCKRELDRAVDNLKWVDKHLAYVWNETSPEYHQKLRERLELAGQMASELSTFIERINQGM